MTYLFTGNRWKNSLCYKKKLYGPCRFRTNYTCIQSPTLTLTSYMNLSKTFNLSEPQCSQIREKEKILANLILVVRIHNHVCEVFSSIYYLEMLNKHYIWLMFITATAGNIQFFWMRKTICVRGYICLQASWGMRNKNKMRHFRDRKHPHPG